MELEKYRKLEGKISEARSLFFEKGVIKRDVIDDQIAFSWLRYKYKNVDPKARFEGQNEGAEKAPEGIEKTIDIDWSNAWIGYFDKSGQVIKYYGNEHLEDLVESLKIYDDQYGNNGIAHAFSNNDWSYVIGKEHYQDALMNYISIGIPVDTGSFIGVLVPLESFEDTHWLQFSDINADRIVKLLFKVKEKNDDTQDLYFFRIESPAFKAFTNQLNRVKDAKPNVIAISGLNGSGRMTTACWLHLLRYKSLDSIMCIDALECILDDNTFKFEKMEEGTLVIKNIMWSDSTFQSKIIEKVLSKPVNSNHSKQSNKNGLSVIFILSDSENSNPLYTRLNPSLQSILNMCQLRIPSFKAVGLEFKDFVKREIIHISKKRYNHSIQIDADVLTALTEYHWPNQYRDLINITDWIVMLVQKDREEEWGQFYKRLGVSQPSALHEFDLKKNERKLIERALKICNSNISKTADQLGITRATLYKKIKEYELDKIV